MARPRIFNGHLHAPFFIFFRRDPWLADDQILAHFGLSTHEYTAKLASFSTYAVIADVGDWTMLADDWLYQLWHLPTMRPAIASLAKDREVFAWSIGECDESFEYSLYQSGQLVRQYWIDSPNYNDQVVRIDFGQRLPFESQLLAADLPIDEKMNQFSLNLGISTVVTQDKVRIYSKPYESLLDLAAFQNFGATH